MKEFLINFYPIIHKSVIAMSVITGLIVLKNYKSITSRYFIYFLCYVLLFELIASYPRYAIRFGLQDYIKDTLFEKNFWVYNICWSIGSTIFFSWYFYNNIKSLMSKRIIKYVTVLFLFFSCGYMLFSFNNFMATNAKPILLSHVFIIIICALLYFLEMLNSEKLLNFYKTLSFYVATGIFIWMIIETPLIFFDRYSTKSDMDYVVLKWTIRLLINVFMYSLFTFALIYCRPKHD
ncbi:hypothetical protein [Hanstruepera neustonica]|nr:hypothetical protein [Hanstruepera neustonica]